MRGIFQGCLLALLVFLYSCSSNKKNTAVIIGELKNASHRKIYFEVVLADKDSVLDSTVADGDGKFTMNNVAAKLDYYLLRSDDRNLAYLILKGRESIHIAGDAKNLDKTYSVTGSEETNELLELRRFERHLSDSLNHEYTLLRDMEPAKKDSVGMTLQQSYEAIMRNFSLDFIQRHANSIVSLSASQYLDKAKDNTLFEQLDSTLRASYPDNMYVQEFSKLVEGMKKLPVGGIAPEIKLRTTEGKEVALSSMKGKVVLVDFWASWCEPCRRENPKMIELYDKFKGKDFEMLGVSLDDNSNAWKEANVHDHLVWTQVSELKKWKSQCVSDYGIDEIPFTILIDRKGRILEKGLHGSELEVKIQKAISEHS